MGACRLSVHGFPRQTTHHGHHYQRAAHNSSVCLAVCACQSRTVITIRVRVARVLAEQGGIGIPGDFHPREQACPGCFYSDPAERLLSITLSIADGFRTEIVLPNVNVRDLDAHVCENGVMVLQVRLGWAGRWCSRSARADVYVQYSSGKIIDARAYTI
ncbi:hypothetical protein BV25DRAFT_619034 [Artomyces pyxidatus]|uniref:Uncharacterized protein n=1 Tax=Artomyces pyxidatus TaxID=48021 RepID=A0ACB8T2M6_9AGAM|nr:hypothetical protein BV25DRAFT_619034 [Artomyces pyxidatus]